MTGSAAKHSNSLHIELRDVRAGREKLLPHPVYIVDHFIRHVERDTVNDLNATDLSFQGEDKHLERQSCASRALIQSVTSLL
jgi:hypothetical protein